MLGGTPILDIKPSIQDKHDCPSFVARDGPQPRNPREWQSWIILYPHPPYSLSHKLSRIPFIKKSGPWSSGFEPLPAGVVLLQWSSIPATKRYYPLTVAVSQHPLLFRLRVNSPVLIIKHIKSISYSTNVSVAQMLPCEVGTLCRRNKRKISAAASGKGPLWTCRPSHLK